jgi:hypothetical protein
VITVTLGTVASAIGEQQLGAVLDEAAIFLRGARQEARHVDEGHDRDVEGVAEAHEARALREASMSSTPASTIGWLATKPTVRPRCGRSR